MLVQMYVKQAHYQRFGTQIINLQFKIIKYNVTHHKFFSATFYYLCLYGYSRTITKDKKLCGI